MSNVIAFWVWLLGWFRQLFRRAPAAVLEPAPVLPPPPLPPPPVFPHRPGRFVKPKGEAPKKQPAKPRQPRKSRVKLPEPKPSTEDPEQWGQYYFRDAILDQLETYFLYLKRMKKGDRDAYDLLHQIGIQLMPGSAIESFDGWRTEGQLDELSAWWKATRPAFGAVAYGISKRKQEQDDLTFVDAPPEFFQNRSHTARRHVVDMINGSSPIVSIYGGEEKIEVTDGHKEQTGRVWVPKFLYYTKCSKIIWRRHKLEPVRNADLYIMTIYWDRVKGGGRHWHRSHPGGSPQQYILAIDKTTNVVRLVKHQHIESVSIQSRHGTIHVPNKYWSACPKKYFGWAYGYNNASPEQYLIRCFIEAALMYESSAMGSMVRIEVSKEGLVCTFGVDIKRMSYFFKDRDIVLTDKGKRARIFHIVRPHMRHTKKGETFIKLSFRGLRAFTWAGYRVRITVPGRDHADLGEFDVACESRPPTKNDDEIGMQKLGKKLVGWMDEGVGKWQPTKR